MEMDSLESRLDSLFDRICSIKDGIPSFKMLIGGEWRDAAAGSQFDVNTPIDGSIIARAQMASAADVDYAVEAARKNRGIRDLPGIERVDIFNCAAGLLEQHKDLFAWILQMEAGKSIKDAAGELEATIQRLNLTMQEARRISGDYIPGDWSYDAVGKMALVIREPIGVVAVISPFNYPLFIASTKLIPALLAGNSVVVKPSSYNPVSALLLVKILEASGVPEGSLNVITGKGEEAGDALVTHEQVGMINFTGSTPVGKNISRMVGLKKLHLELGGKGYAIVLEDADLDLAAQKCVSGSFKFSGQRCDAISAILAVGSIADSLSAKIIKEVDRWKFGDPRDGSVMLGPVINPEAAIRIHGMVTDAIEKGAKLLRGGKFHGSYYEPTVLDYIPESAVISHEETFGPIVAILRPKDENEALRIAGQSKYGLESCVFSKDFYKIWRVAKRLECGEVTINDFPSHGVGYFPFGGIKDSGMGREGIGYSIDEMTNLKTIVFNLEAEGLGKREHEAATCKSGIFERASS
jgi:glyceraldehyde-3-phosphate dehydrogenase [NAD(P)+]